MFERELLQRGHAAGVLLFDPVLDQVVLIEQFRVGALPQSAGDITSPWLLELVAGVIDADERAEAGARPRKSLDAWSVRWNTSAGISAAPVAVLNRSISFAAGWMPVALGASTGCPKRMKTFACMCYLRFRHGRHCRMGG